MISRRIIIAALIALGVSFFAGKVSAVDKNGNFMIMNNITCGEYLDAYSRSTLTGAATTENAGAIIPH